MTTPGATWLARPSSLVWPSAAYSTSSTHRTRFISMSSGASFVTCSSSRKVSQRRRRWNTVLRRWTSSGSGAAGFRIRKSNCTKRESKHSRPLGPQMVQRVGDRNSSYCRLWGTAGRYPVLSWCIKFAFARLTGGPNPGSCLPVFALYKAVEINPYQTAVV